MNLQSIETSISLGEISEAMTALVPFTQNTPKASTVLLLQSRFSRIREELQKGIVSGDDARIEKNKITAALTEIVEELKKKLGGNNSVSSSPLTVNGDNNQIYVGVNNSNINTTTQNHWGSGDNVAGNKIVGN